MSSDASKEWSGTFTGLEQKRDKIKPQIQHHLSEHQKLDKYETRDDARAKRHEQAIETLNAARERISQLLKSNSPRTGQGKRVKEAKSNITDNESAKMTTSKGTIQGYNGLATADKKHQIIIDAQAFGEGQEHHTLQPITEAIQEPYNRLKISDNIYQTGAIVTADTGFANEANMQYLHDNHINGYIPDNQFRSRDPKFADQKSKYGKRHQDTSKKTPKTFPTSAFIYDPKTDTCECPAGKQLTHIGNREDQSGHQKAFFIGQLLQCRHCEIKHQCMKRPESSDRINGRGRQVSFMLDKSKKSKYTD